jgi:hypothetical protein
MHIYDRRSELRRRDHEFIDGAHVGYCLSKVKRGPAFHDYKVVILNNPDHAA